MGGACKLLLNSGVRALSEAMERVLTNLHILAGRLSQDEADGLLERLTKLDLNCADGADGDGDSLLKILAVLVDRKIVTDEVWRLYARPAG